MQCHIKNPHHIKLRGDNKQFILSVDSFEINKIQADLFFHSRLVTMAKT